jgi:cell division protein FtsI (penicillin-binding protein 3)
LHCISIFGSDRYAVKLTNIQWVEGDYYRKLAKKERLEFCYSFNKGNIYSSDGSLLATSIPNEIRFDALAKMEIFEKNVQSLSDSLAFVLGKPSSFIKMNLEG